MVNRTIIEVTEDTGTEAARDKKRLLERTRAE